MIRRPPRSTLSSSSAASDVYKRQVIGQSWLQGVHGVDEVHGEDGGQMSKAQSPVSARRRVMAWVALGSAALLGLAVAVLLVRHALDLILCLVGLALAVAGGWWVLTERMPRRAVGMVGLAVGVLMMLVALVRVATTNEILLR